MLSDSVKSVANTLNNTLHSGVRDAGLIHIIVFAAFLEAALELRNKRARYEHVLDKVKSYVPLPFRAHITRLTPDAAIVIREVGRVAASAVVVGEASVKVLREKLAKTFCGRIGHVLVIDALSPIEFASLLVVAERSGYYCDLSSEFLVNPVGVTWFVKEQVREEEKRLRKYAKEIAEVLMSPRYGVSFTFDKAIHTVVGDVAAFLRGERGESPLKAVWEEVKRAAAEVEASATVLLTTDHGYGVYEGGGTLFVDHGRKNSAILTLEPVALVALLERGEV